MGTSANSPRRGPTAGLYCTPAFCRLPACGSPVEWHHEKYRFWSPPADDRAPGQEGAVLPLPLLRPGDEALTGAVSPCARSAETRWNWTRGERTCPRASATGGCPAGWSASPHASPSNKPPSPNHSSSPKLPKHLRRCAESPASPPRTVRARADRGLGDAPRVVRRCRLQAARLAEPAIRGARTRNDRCRGTG